MQQLPVIDVLSLHSTSTVVDPIPVPLDPVVIHHVNTSSYVDGPSPNPESNPGDPLVVLDRVKEGQPHELAAPGPMNMTVYRVSVWDGRVKDYKVDGEYMTQEDAIARMEALKIKNPDREVKLSEHAPELVK